MPRHTRVRFQPTMLLDSSFEESTTEPTHVSNPIGHRRTWGLTLSVAVLGLLMSAWLVRWSQDAEALRRQTDVTRVADRISVEVLKRLTLPLRTLEGVRGLYSATGRINGGELVAYLGSSPSTTVTEAVQAYARIEVEPKGADPASSALLVREILPQRGQPIGLKADDDVARIPGLRAEWASRARSGLASLSLLGPASAEAAPTAPTPAFVLALPVFDLDQRNAPAKGWIAAVLQIDQLLSGLTQPGDGDFGVQLCVDLAAKATEGAPPLSVPCPVVYRSPNLSASGIPGDGLERAVTQTLTWQGQIFRLKVAPSVSTSPSLTPISRVLGVISALLALGLAWGVFNMLSGRRRAEHLVQERSQDLAQASRDIRSLLGIIRQHSLVSVTDGEGRITEVNDKFCTVSGYTREELLGQNHSLIASSTHPPEFWGDMWRTLQRGKTWVGVVCNQARDGRPIWWDTVIAPFFGADGSLNKIVAVRHDITPLLRMQQRMAEQGSRLQLAADTAGLGVWEWTPQGGPSALRWDDRCWRIFDGNPQADPPITPLDCLARRLSPTDFAELTRQMNSASEGHDTVAHEMHFSVSDGRDRYVTFSAQLVRDDKGLPLRLVGVVQDVTDQRLAELEIRTSRSLLNRTGAIGGVGGWQIQLGDDSVSWTDTACRIFDLPEGYQPTLTEINQWLDPKHSAYSRSLLTRAQESSQGFDEEVQVTSSTGRPLWVRVVAEVELDNDKPVRLVGAVQDITERRALMQTISENNALLRRIVDSLPCGLGVFDANQRLLLVNNEYGRLLDMPQVMLQCGELYFESILERCAERGDYGPGDSAALAARWLAKAGGNMRDFGHELIRVNGLALDVRGSPLPDGGFVTTYTDISARRTAEHQAREWANLLRGAIDVIDEAFVIFDPEDKLVMCNERYRQVNPDVAHMMEPGVTFAELAWATTTLTAFDGQPCTPESRSAIVIERLRRRRDNNTDKWIATHADGVVESVMDRRLPSGHIVGMRVNITEFVAAKEAAEAAVHAKSLFLANMSHEIRTPMNAIIGMMALLGQTALGPQQKDLVGKAHTASRSLLGLLDDILDFSKAEAGKMELDVRPFDIQVLLRDLSVIFSASLSNPQVEILFDIAPDVPQWLAGDAMRLQQVLVNLGGNAIKFTPAGEVVVRVSRLSAPELPAHQVRLGFAVQDTGIGIAPENQQRIFESFTQAESNITRQFGGTGLGLSISQRLVHLMGSQLALDSTVGAGSTFSFAVDLALAEPSAEALDASPSPGWRVLVVDDNATSRSIMQHMGATLGWAVETVASGEAALTWLEHEQRNDDPNAKPVDAVLIDWQMPGMDGMATAKHMTTRGLLPPNALMLMLTANGSDMLAQQSDTDRALLDGYLIKPVTPASLREGLIQSQQERRQGNRPQPAPVPLPQRLARRVLLLVEDNPINQQVAAELLASEGATVEVVNNGQQGLDRLMATLAPGVARFDAVLMDLQMPVMDGFSATRLVRDIPALRDLPIIAMTANASASDREACTAVGMNDHVGKPFDLDHLVETVLRWTPQPHPAVAPARPSAPPPAPAESGAHALPQAVQEAAVAMGLDVTRALARMGGQIPIYRRMLIGLGPELDRLLQLMDQDSARFQAALTEPNVDPAAAQATAADISRHVHTLKGLAGTLGLSDLSSIAAKAEKPVLTAHDSDALQHGLQPVMTATRQTRRQLDDLLAQWPQAAPAISPAAHDQAADLGPEDTAACSDGLRRLLSLLKASDMDAVTALDKLPRPSSQPAAQRHASLEAAVQSLDFDGAIALIELWLADRPNGDTPHHEPH